MKIIQATRSIDNATFEPVALITLELRISEVQEFIQSKDDAAFERFIGREYLKALHAFLNEPDAVQDVEVQKNKEEEDVALVS